MKDKMIAYCGLNCKKCDAYKATVNDDNELREQTAKLWAEMNNAPITADMINCLGCRADGVKTPYCASLCPVRQCALKKGYETCGDCENIKSCEAISGILNFSEEARNNLLKKEMTFEELTVESVDINKLVDMASVIWHEHYDKLIGVEQVVYMLNKFLSVEAIEEQLKRGYVYDFVCVGGQRVGFVSYCIKSDCLYLSKLYLLKSERGKGYSKEIIAFLKDKAKSANRTSIVLNVNKGNDAIKAYEALGFKRLRAEKNDIGGGYFMDDYVYELKV